MNPIHGTAIVLVVSGTFACLQGIRAFVGASDLEGVLLLGLGFLVLRSAERLVDTRRGAS